MLRALRWCWIQIRKIVKMMQNLATKEKQPLFAILVWWYMKLFISALTQVATLLFCLASVCICVVEVSVYILFVFLWSWLCLVLIVIIAVYSFVLSVIRPHVHILITYFPCFIGFFFLCFFYLAYLFLLCFVCLRW